ncbi:MAG: Holliday junction resolvase RuvX [Geminicoccales bacterium]
MPILGNIEALVDLGRGRLGLLALDVSRRAIGLAGADPSWRLATPIGTIRRRGRWADDVAALRKVIAEREAAALVIGWPLNMDGSEGTRCQSVRAFVRNLDAALGLPMLFWDERLTTFAAQEARTEAGRVGRRGHRSVQTLDALAAATILQDALDAAGRLTAGRRTLP